MRQLLDVSEKYTILGLSNRVFVGRLDRNDEVYELLVTPVPSSSANTSTACLPQASPSATDKDNTNSRDVDPHEVQAVSLLRDKNRLYCAVVCYNKNLFIYDIDLIHVNKPSSTSAHWVQPAAVHKTSKRAGSLCFARVPDEFLDDEASRIVVIAGDLAGDAVAFSLADPSSSTSSLVANRDLQSTREEADEDEDKETDETNDSRKLLLGHTASMLTGVKVVKDRAHSRILTSDRDEKVRVSNFPNTFLIHGYLLGHEAFISSMDASSSDGRTRCITCSGDGTVRLWDYVTCQELSSLSVSDGSRVPSRVAMNQSATLAAVIFDESPRLYLLRINPDNESLEILSSQECASYALSLAMLEDDETLMVLVSEAPFVQAFRLSASSTTSEGEPPVSATSMITPFVDALTKLLSSEGGVTRMPTSVLEKDRYGQPMMKKKGDKRGPAFEHPWNNAERKVIAKERSKRYKKHKREAEQGKSLSESEKEESRKSS